MKTGLTLFLSILLLAGLAPAQNISSSVKGVLADPTGSALAGAEVKLIQQGTGTTLHATGRVFQLHQHAGVWRARNEHPGRQRRSDPVGGRAARYSVGA